MRAKLPPSSGPEPHPDLDTIATLPTQACAPGPANSLMAESRERCEFRVTILYASYSCSGQSSLEMGGFTAAPKRYK
jgi:hypothetical protein